jgi:hypothetical protein
MEERSAPLRLGQINNIEQQAADEPQHDEAANRERIEESAVCPRWHRFRAKTIELQGGG